VPNPKGHAESLVASHPQATHAVRHGLYSKSGRVLAPRAHEIAEALMSLPHVAGLDAIAAEEIGSLLAALEAIDRDLEKRTPARAGGRLLEHKARLSRELRAYLREFGATPRSRFDFAAAQGGASLAAEIARRRAALNGEVVDE
jgi:hypothetical protein